MSRLRVSAISFLNTAPLMWDFDHGGLRRKYEVSYTVPSACAEMLRTGTADIGIVPVAAYTTIPDLVVIPDVAIAARGPVRSIYLISKKPVEEIKTVATDTSSRTSVALLRVLMEQHWRTKPEFIPMEPKLEPMLAKCDAALLIGDPALLAFQQLDRTKFGAYDLAEEWMKLTGKPFVFAFWAVRKPAGAGAEVAADFATSRDHGLEPQNIAHLAGEWSNRLGLTPEQVSAYLTEAIYYRLDQGCLEGLHLFFEQAAACAALPSAPKMQFLDAPVK